MVSPGKARVFNGVAADGFPSFLGASASGNRIFVATREGRLICFEGS